MFVVCFGELVQTECKSFGQSSMHQTLDLYTDQPGKNAMYQNLKSSKGHTVRQRIKLDEMRWAIAVYNS